MKSVALFDFHIRRPLRGWSWIALLLGAIALLTAAEFNRALQRRVDEASLTKANLDATLRQNKAKTLAAAKKPDFDKPVKNVLAPLVYPWNQVFMELEAAHGERINLVKFEHNIRDRSVHLVVAGASYEAIQALTERLQQASGASATWRTQSISRNPQGLRAAIEGRYSD